MILNQSRVPTVLMYAYGRFSCGIVGLSKCNARRTTPVRQATRAATVKTDDREEVRQHSLVRVLTTPIEARSRRARCLPCLSNSKSSKSKIGGIFPLKAVDIRGYNKYIPVLYLLSERTHQTRSSHRKVTGLYSHPLAVLLLAILLWYPSLLL